MSLSILISTEIILEQTKPMLPGRTGIMKVKLNHSSNHIDSEVILLISILDYVYSFETDVCDSVAIPNIQLFNNTVITLLLSKIIAKFSPSENEIGLTDRKRIVTVKRNVEPFEIEFILKCCDYFLSATSENRRKLAITDLLNFPSDIIEPKIGSLKKKFYY